MTSERIHRQRDPVRECAGKVYDRLFHERNLRRFRHLRPDHFVIRYPDA